MNQTVLSKIQFFIKFLKPKDIWGLGGNLKKIIERTIRVNL